MNGQTESYEPDDQQFGLVMAGRRADGRDAARSSVLLSLPTITEQATLRRIAEQAAAHAEQAASKAPPDQAEAKQAEAIARTADAANLAVPPVPRWLVDDATPTSRSRWSSTSTTAGLRCRSWIMARSRRRGSQQMPTPTSCALVGGACGCCAGWWMRCALSGSTSAPV